MSSNVISLILRIPDEMTVPLGDDSVFSKMLFAEKITEFLGQNNIKVCDTEKMTTSGGTYLFRRAIQDHPFGWISISSNKVENQSENICDFKYKLPDDLKRELEEFIKSGNWKS